jgi:DNA-binding MarR family transcriptional regulator
VSDFAWLSSSDQRTWRLWLHVNASLSAVLHRELQSEAGLSLSDFAVLVQLTDRPEGRVRVTDLARELQWERSRVSHHITRMKRRGLVQREECFDDGRGAWIMLSGEGRAAIEMAAPAHVQTVRRLVFDVLAPAEIDALSTVLDKVLASLEKYAPDRRTGQAQSPRHAV